MQVIKEFEARELANNIKVKIIVKNGHQWRRRLWLAEKLIKLGCWIAWLNCEFVSSENKDEDC